MHLYRCRRVELYFKKPKYCFSKCRHFVTNSNRDLENNIFAEIWMWLRMTNNSCLLNLTGLTEQRGDVVYWVFLFLLVIVDLIIVWKHPHHLHSVPLQNVEKCQPCDDCLSCSHLTVSPGQLGAQLFHPWL